MAGDYGLRYRIITNEIRKRLQIGEATQLEAARALFPWVKPVDWTKKNEAYTPPPLFEEEELLEAVSGLKTGKAAVPDNISPEIARSADASQKEEEFLPIANDIIVKRNAEWKDVRLALIEKAKKSMAAYRPMSS